jgi:hypothetical protein
MAGYIVDTSVIPGVHGGEAFVKRLNVGNDCPGSRSNNEREDAYARRIHLNGFGL